MSKHIESVLSLDVEEQPALRVRLPEIFRDYKRVVREVSLRVVGNNIHATYAERSGDVSAKFKPQCSYIADGIFEALAWAEGQGHAPGN
jgi:hypothetical protein